MGGLRPIHYNMTVKIYKEFLGRLMPLIEFTMKANHYDEAWDKATLWIENNVAEADRHAIFAEVIDHMEEEK
jgi:hypothetical protein